MRLDLDDALVRDFPALYRERHGDSSEPRMCDGFPGDGWEPLVRRMSEKLELICAATGLHADQIKEKIGALRVYLNSSGPIPDEVNTAISDAVQESRRVNDRPHGATADRPNGSTDPDRRWRVSFSVGCGHGGSAKRIHSPQGLVHHVEASC